MVGKWRCQDEIWKKGYKIVLLAILIKDIKHGVKTSIRYVYLFKVNCDTVEILV
jgi:hypothetical protein